jgi:hypothetical protein
MRNGGFVPYGRSLTYRFAAYAFWGALVYAGVDQTSTIKGILFRGLDMWEQSLGNHNEITTIGLKYSNLCMGEEYNGYGSSLWAYKSYIFLIGDNEAFWNEKIGEFPKLRSKLSCNSIKGMILRDNKNDIVTWFPNNICFDYGLLGYNAKYMKFAYNSLFPFSIPRGNNCYAAGGFDSTITIKIADNIYLDRNVITAGSLDNGIQISNWKIGDFISTCTYLIPGASRHYRIHLHSVNKNIILYESGFSISQNNNRRIIESEFAETSNELGISSIKSVYGNGAAGIIKNYPNTNIEYIRTEMPYLEWRFTPGNYLVITEVVGGKEKIGEKSSGFIFQKKNNKLFVSFNGMKMKIDLKQCTYARKVSFRYIKRKGTNLIKHILRGL